MSRRRSSDYRSLPQDRRHRREGISSAPRLGVPTDSSRLSPVSSFAPAMISFLSPPSSLRATGRLPLARGHPPTSSVQVSDRSRLGELLLPATPENRCAFQSRTPPAVDVSTPGCVTNSATGLRRVAVQLGTPAPRSDTTSVGHVPLLNRTASKRPPHGRRAHYDLHGHAVGAIHQCCESVLRDDRGPPGYESNDAAGISTRPDAHPRHVG